ncbi:MAG: response regulator [Planctomycetota bacterium]
MSTPLHPQRILIADDEHLMATGLSSSLSSLGYDVIGLYADGLSALEAAREHKPDLLILDIRMPEKDGLQVASEIWEECQIPSVMITAYSDPQYIEQAQETGVFGYLLKPVSTENLRVSICIAWSKASEMMAKGARIEQLERSLVERRTVEQAKWKLIESTGMSEPDAHAAMQKKARSHRLRLLDIANQIIEGDLSLLSDSGAA